MTTTPEHIESDRLLDAASAPASTPFDYIVVGSGAGGGPLAARLALEGRRVLVIEAGIDPATPTGAIDLKSTPADPNTLRETYAVPAYHAASTEDPEISWDFSVRHFADDARQREDSKYDAARDPSVTPGKGKGGIFYPRASALGGCTAHHAMVIVRPNDSDWDRIAESTRDETWRSENMQGYFAKIEQCLYYQVYKGVLGRILGGLLRLVQWVATQLNPRQQLDPGGHGSTGWQKTSFIDPLVVAGIVKRDRAFLSVLWDVLWSALLRKDERSRIFRALARLQIVQFLDPNVRSPDFATRVSRLSLIPIGTDGRSRCGLREHLLDVARKYPDRLVLLTGTHVTRVLFEGGENGGPPRAVGVEVVKGPHLYRASPLSASKEKAAEPYFARREVILCGGAFNTPQILMLSGIGDAKHLQELHIDGPRDRDGRPVAERINLPGVGANLQDRYEISVVSKTKKPFSTLERVSFRPGDSHDPAREEWRRDKTGLYTTNGGALSMMVSSEANRRVGEPDLFFFGVPAAFRGYYHGWSKEFLCATKGAGVEHRNLWTWVILKAYTHNDQGTVRLLSADPFATPEIIFNSFGAGEASAQDLDALCDAVRKVREINGCIETFASEIQPGEKKPNASKELADWVQNEAWGHHACGTCRIGPDAWCSDPRRLSDPFAVVDSEFRVHGVRGLRVVDASVFPEIPGYFIVTSVFMIGEKAADVLLASASEYPSALEQVEATAIHARRKAVADSHAAVAPASTITSASSITPATMLPDNAIGLALSGGGIRSATFCLGVLQALAACGKLRRIDFLSTVSGGGYVGAFLGRLYTRLAQELSDKAGRVEEVLASTRSSEIWWLRKHADYVHSAGRVDLETNLAIVARNLGSVHLLVAALLFALFGVLRWLADAFLSGVPTRMVWGIELSVWWWVPLVVLFVVVAPQAVGYWLAPNFGKRYAVVPLLLWSALLASAVYGLAIRRAAPWSGVAIVVLLLAWVVHEVAQWRLARDHRGAPAGAAGIGMAADGEPDSVPGTLVRNRLTRALGVGLLAFAVTIVWVALDSLARRASHPEMMPVMGWAMLGFAPLVLVLRIVAVAWLQGISGDSAERWYDAARRAIVAGLAFALATILIFFVDVLAHLTFNTGRALGVWTTITALAGSAVVGRWFAFLNLSSLQQSYAQKLVRTFLGASNDARVHPTGASSPLAVEIPSADDDLFFDDYHPERTGGPLHLINVCVNDTVAGDSGRQLREDKGLPMCVGPGGVSVGRRYHALWQPGESQSREADGPRRWYRALGRWIDRGTTAGAVTVRPLAVAPDPNAFHLLARADHANPAVERLRLGQWTSISGAAVATGTGRFTNLPQSLFLGLLNVRLGYWWDSGIRAGQRPGRYPPNLWRRAKSLPASILRMQSTLLNEWRGYFPGPAERLWYLSDGGHFENTGLYELVRRRLPFIIAVDGGEDQQYELDDLAILTRQVRLDFGVEIEWLKPTVPLRTQSGDSGRAEHARAFPDVPGWIQAFFNEGAVGALAELKRDGRCCAALARVTYRGDRNKPSWLLLLKANLAPTMPLDVRNYADRHSAFPNESTANQFFKDDQWESYRALGQCAGKALFG